MYYMGWDSRWCAQQMLPGPNGSVDRGEDDRDQRAAFMGVLPPGSRRLALAGLT